MTAYPTVFPQWVGLIAIGIGIVTIGVAIYLLRAEIWACILLKARKQIEAEQGTDFDEYHANVRVADNPSIHEQILNGNIVPTPRPDPRTPNVVVNAMQAFAQKIGVPIENWNVSQLGAFQNLLGVTSGTHRAPYSGPK